MIERRMYMFKLVNGSKENGVIVRSDICWICDNYRNHDQCINCDGFVDICLSYDRG